MTVAFAVLGVGLGATAGFVLALGFARFPAVRVFAASIRSVHDLFWALLLLQVTALSPTTGILAIGIPYAGIFAKVFAEMIEEADLSAERLLPLGTSMLSRFAYTRLPGLAGSVRTYLLCRLECGLRSTLVLGFYVDGAIAELRLDVAVVLIVATGGLSMAIDAFPRALHRRLRINDRAEATACG